MHTLTLQDPRKAQLRSMFSRIAGEDNEVDAEELQDILTASLSKGTVGYWGTSLLQ